MSLRQRNPSHLSSNSAQADEVISKVHIITETLGPLGSSKFHQSRKSESETLPCHHHLHRPQIHSRLVSPYLGALYVSTTTWNDLGTYRSVGAEQSREWYRRLISRELNRYWGITNPDDERVCWCRVCVCDWTSKSRQGMRAVVDSMSAFQTRIAWERFVAT